MLFSHFFTCCINFVRKLPRKRFAAQLPRSLPETPSTEVLLCTASAPQHQPIWVSNRSNTPASWCILATEPASRLLAAWCGYFANPAGDVGTHPQTILLANISTC